MNYLIPSCSHMPSGINAMPLPNTHLIEWYIDDDAPTTSEVPGNNLGETHNKGALILCQRKTEVKRSTSRGDRYCMDLILSLLTPHPLMD